jgi:type III secretion system YscD/HrpQ family protein
MPSEQDLQRSNDSATMPAKAPAWQLAVLGGLHAGAVVDVSADDWTLVGSAEDCDIVLRDAGVLPHHAALFPRGTQLQLRTIDGPVSALCQAQAPGSSITLADAVSWQIHGVSLGVGLAGSAAWEALRAQPPLPSTAADAADAADHAAFNTGSPDDADIPADETRPLDDNAAAPPRPPLHLRWTRKAQHVLAGVAACALVLATGTVAWGMIWQKVQARETSSAIAGTLSGLQMPELRVIEAANGHLRIEGTVRSESERATLMNALQQRGIYPAVDVVSGEQLAGTVQNSFRQRGLHVKADYAGGGRIEVHGAAPSPVTEQVIQDVLSATNAVTQVALLDAAAQPPAGETTGAATAPAAPPPAAADNAGRDPKRVVGVVGGDSPYVLTQDGRHYFIGSMLPDGTQVDQIEGHVVVFSRQGKPTTVAF